MNHARGFTLIELAIVLVIITFLIGGLAMPLSAQIEVRRIAETRQTLDEAREAIIGYASVNTFPASCSCNYDAGGAFASTDCSPALPCPASDPTGTGTLTQNYVRHYLPCPDTDNDGRENRQAGNPNACSASAGLLPWVTLASAQHDAWGNRLRYAVAENLADKTIGFHSQPVPAGAWNQVLTSTAQCAPLDVDVAADVPVVVLSHGPNSRGARNAGLAAASATPAPAAGTDANELQNLGTTQGGCTARTFVAGNPSEAFDDLVEWVSFPRLISRVCPAGGCP